MFEFFFSHSNYSYIEENAYFGKKKTNKQNEFFKEEVKKLRKQRGEYKIISSF